MVVSEGAISNIMGGMENTAGVRLHSHRHKLKQRFDIIRKLGQGTYGKVQLAINKETGKEVAIKTIKKAKIETEQDLVRIRREIQIMSSVQHPQIIHIYEVFENREKMVLVMEYAAGGELYDYLSERKVLAEAEARRVFRHVASAVYYCHKHKICHRDLKLENILLDLDGNAKIADFGLSNVFDEKHRLDTFCGSPLYASPEIVKGVPYVGPEVDCWSLGVLLYTLVYGAMPFDGSNFRRLVKQITLGDFYEPSSPASASELIRHMLTVESADRASIEDICNHWWVNEGFTVSCLTEAEALANLTPVRLDLLLSLAPKHISSEHLLIQPEDNDCMPVTKVDPDSDLPLPEGAENEAIPPPRSHSMGSLLPVSLPDVDLMLEKKRRERRAYEEKKRPNDEVLVIEKKKKRDHSAKKSSKLQEESTENERVQKEVTEEEEKKHIHKKKEPSVDIEPKVSKKRESSVTKKSPSLKNYGHPKDTSAEPENEITLVEKTAVKTVSSKRSPSPAPSTSSTLKASDSSISRKSVSPVKASAEEHISVKPKKKSITKSGTFDKKTPEQSPKAISIDKILQETAAKIEKVEERLVKKEKEEISVPPTMSPKTLSPQSSVTSSQATTPARSRTGSESSSDNRTSKGETSRRQSKIFSKAAMFDSMLSSGTKSPPSVDKPKKIIRPGALNMSDLAKRFEDKPSVEKKTKVVSPFKVSDARKAFESKTDQSLDSLRRKTSVGSSGPESQSTSPRESLPTSPRESLPTSPRESLPTSPSVSKTFAASSMEPISPPIKVDVSVKPKPLPAAKETSPIKESAKKSLMSKSPSKDLKNSISSKKEKSPSVKKEKSPSFSTVKKEKSPTRVRPIDKRDKSPTSIIVTKEKSSSPIKSKENILQSKIPKGSSDSTIQKIEEGKQDSKRIIAAAVPAARLIEIMADTSDSSDSECEAEKMLRVLAEKREKLERAKKEKLREVSKMKKEKHLITEDQKVITEPENNNQKFATLPRGFKSKAPGRPKPVKAKVSSIDDSGPRKRSQMEIVLNQQPIKKQPLSKPIKPQKSFEIKISRDNSRPEFRTEIEHNISTSEVRHIEPHLQRARRERIIPIMMEDDAKSSPLQPSSSSSSKASSSSSTRVTNFGMAPISSTLGSSAAAERNRSHPPVPTEAIKKSRRERIIPIAVEGEGLITPPISVSASSEGVASSFQRQGSGASSSINRGRSFLLDRTESFSSAGEDDDSDDDGFQIMTAESLFSTLLSRVRNLTRKMADDGRMRRTPQQPNLIGAQEPGGFWSSLYSPPRESPSGRISEGLSPGQSKDEDSFGGFTSPMWPRNSMSRDGSDADSVFSESSSTFSTLPRAEFLRNNLLLRHNKMFNDTFFSDFTRT